MSDSLMSRSERAKFLRSRRARMKMAEIYERQLAGESMFLTPVQAVKSAFANKDHMESEIEWRHRELQAGAREY